RSDAWKRFLDLAHFQERSGVAPRVGPHCGAGVRRGAHGASVARVPGSIGDLKSAIEGKPCAASGSRTISTRCLSRMSPAVSPLTGRCGFDCHTPNGLSNKARSGPLEPAQSRENVDALRPPAYGSMTIAWNFEERTYGRRSS